MGSRHAGCFAANMRSLRPRLDHIAPLLLALAPLGLTGCGLGGFDETVCLHEGLPGLSPAEADYVALRSQTPDVQPSTITIVSAFGQPCTKAADSAACEAALSALVMDSPLLSWDGGFDLPVEYDVVFSAGDTVGRVATRTELLALLGEIDTPDDALLLSFADGHNVPCGQPNARVEEDGTIVLLGSRGSGCGAGDDKVHYEIRVGASGEVVEGASQVVEVGDPNCAIGRRPRGLRSRGPALRSVGAFFASAAHLEAASVPAFEHLARELTHHGAPAALVRSALRSAREEVRHAAVVSRLARRYGASPARPVVDRMPVRSLLDVAVDNASEGCIRETFGAVVAGVQARRSCDPVVRRALAAIAVDEARHAALSWAIDDWARSRLSSREAGRVLEAREASADNLAREIERPVPESVRSHAGIPDVATSRRLLRAMNRSLLDLV